MPKCPNCFYLLVLLEKRRKYKCAKCSQLFSQKEIDSKKFREWNEKERKKGRKQWKKEQDQSYQAKKLIPKIIEDLKNPKPKKTRKQYYLENRDKILQQKREYRKNLSGQAKKEQNEKRQGRRNVNIGETRLKGRIEYWRQKQKALALVQYEFAYDKACTQQFQSILPTSLHSDLLNKSQSLYTLSYLSIRRRP